MYGYQPTPANHIVRTKIIFYPPKLTVAEVLVDIGVGPKGGGPYFDHVVNALRYSVVEKNNGIVKKRWQNWPIFCETSIEHEIIE
jgi:hypothetical protein